MLNDTFSVIFQHLNCILVSTLARWDDQRDDVNQQAWEQPRKKSSQIYENYTAMLLLLNWKVSVKMPACQRLSKITSWKSLWWIARKRFPISSSCCSWQPEEHESFNFFSVHSLIHFQSGMDGSVNSSASWQETRDFSLLPLIDIFFSFSNG